MVSAIDVLLLHKGFHYFLACVMSCLLEAHMRHYLNTVFFLYIYRYIDIYLYIYISICHTFGSMDQVKNICISVVNNKCLFYQHTFLACAKVPE